VPRDFMDAKQNHRMRTGVKFLQLQPARIFFERQGELEFDSYRKTKRGFPKFELPLGGRPRPPALRVESHSYPAPCGEVHADPECGL